MSNTKEIVPISWYFTCQLTRIYENFKSNISDAYKVQVNCLKDSESDSYHENDMKERGIDFVRLQEVMQEKLITASYSEQIKVFTLVPECTVQNILVSLNTLFELHVKSKKKVKY